MKRLLVLVLIVLTAMVSAAQTRVAVVLPANASSVERAAADELVTHLHTLYPSVEFPISSHAEIGSVVFLGTSEDLPAVYAGMVRSKLSGPESFVVDTANSRPDVAVIAGASPRAIMFAVDSLLEKLGFGFYLSYNTEPPPSASPFSFKGWNLNDAPTTDTRLVLEWHNFLSGCSTWNLEDWQRWITQASRMRFNTIMVHAYGNNPMFSFVHNRVTKPTGYLTNTARGRDWGTEHVLDVRKIIGGEGLFDSAIFGADASMVPDGKSVEATTGLMQNVFRFAADRGMNITFALDVDTESANPQNVIATLPLSARFESHGIQLANPDTLDGYAYYRSQIDQLMRLYPQITQIAVWFRGGRNGPWCSLQPEEFPLSWQQEYMEALGEHPSLKGDPEAPGMFAIGKIVLAFRRALDETHHANVALAAGSWRFDFLPSANIFLPGKVSLMPLDYNYELPSDSVQESLRKIGRARPLVPIIWAQHDDREFAGRSYVPFSGLASMLRWSNSAGYGVIHWTTRPLDLYFKNVATQVWATSENEALDQTASGMAKGMFGARAQELGKRYLMAWIYDSPAFGRETSDKFIDQMLDLDNVTEGVNARLQLLVQMRSLTHNARALEWIGYFEDWEHFVRGFYEAQVALQQSISASSSGDVGLAQREIAAASPEKVLEQYSRTIRHVKVSRGEEGILISMNLRWLPYFVAQREAVGLDPLRIKFAPTSHEQLAHAPGNYTFDFNASRQLVEVLGSSEVGVRVQEQGTSELCSGGLEVAHPVTLSITGIVGTSLPPGIYHLRLDMPEDARLEVESGGARQVVKSTSDIQIRVSAGRAKFTLSPLAAASTVCGLTLEPGTSHLRVLQK